MAAVDELLNPGISNWTWDLTSTHAYSKTNCQREFYFIHIFLVYCVFWSGVAAALVRLIPPLKWTHPWFGRLYIACMLLSTASAMLIHNIGLPLFVVLAFCWVLFGMVGGWFVIKLHENKLHDQALTLVESRLKELPSDKPISEAIAEAKGEICQAKTLSQRMWSYKAMHGILMAVSWANIGGRVVVTGINDEFTCFTYPSYKSVTSTQYVEFDNAGKGIQLIEFDDPKYDKLPWGALGTVGWTIMGSVGPVGIATGVGIVYSQWAAQQENGLVGAKSSSRRGAPLVEMSSGG